MGLCKEQNTSGSSLYPLVGLGSYSDSTSVGQSQEQQQRIVALAELRGHLPVSFYASSEGGVGS